ncbi:uncharacterized protein LOC113874631 [Abrus precatorius]|uniref:Uncharacterized protein LOC113874631 n=1 Tax=Abrus precatorius TaxID=3816 RepID=A0A8B8ML63_ABRPR|nr:uncharacterized protein LOC113874631 [Abrus precatorius]
MRRKIHNPTVVHSSVVLLQERFRQLQRVKEMRKERELLKMLSTEPKHLKSSNPTTNYGPTRQFFHPELIMPSKSPPHVSLSLWPTSQRMQDDKRSIVETPVSMNLRSLESTHTQSLNASWKNVYDWDSASDSGVDTSLHL